MREFLYASVGVVLVVTSIPLILRRVPRNGAHGIRFAAIPANGRLQDAAAGRE